MASAAKILAAVGGLAVAFLLVIVLSVLTPPPDLETDAGDVVIQRFHVAEAPRFTAGSEAVFVNEGAVPVTITLRSPGNDSVVFRLEPGGAQAVRLNDEGTYRFASAEYPWLDARLSVLSSNPFERFFDEMF